MNVRSVYFCVHSFLTLKLNLENLVSSIMIQTVMNRISRHELIFIIQNLYFIENHKNYIKLVFKYI